MPIEANGLSKIIVFREDVKLNGPKIEIRVK
jgi:hypothetical protein